ncbi:unnamed protein product [Phytophthora lilii]|uniref:Unnamed protein product n=1 Tax=Phytophthora lilii TaxID=2077276 RepID=A0A9W6WYN4_9STRA|nr:unnamed protein product [Phytophthora lilii]
MRLTLGLALATIAGASSATVSDDSCSFACLDVYEPVCGSNGETYSNACCLRLASCKSNGEITQAGSGECAFTPASTTTSSPETSSSGSASKPTVCPDACLDVYDPVSDENGVEYSNECYMQMAKCKGNDDGTNNRLDNPSFSTLDAQRKLAFAPDYTGPACDDMLCPEKYAPVCGSDGVTCTNECSLGITSCNHPEQNITQVSSGECPIEQQQQQSA